MALTLADEQRMRDSGVIAFYERDVDGWCAIVRDARTYLKEKFPAGAPVRPDDVAKALLPILEVDEDFKTFRDENKLRQKLWIRIFADLLIDRNWAVILAEDQNG